MNSAQKAKANQEDTDKLQVDVERRTRRSSILKPQKPRNPLTTLDFSEPNPDNTLAKAARRVSFASSNLVKPFAADPEKNTIWDSTYEEEINHTDSTKSSYEQTHEAKSKDFFNLTSIYSPESVELEVCLQEESIDKKFVVFDKENLKLNVKSTENSKSFFGSRNVPALEHTLIGHNESMEFTLVDKENVYIVTKDGASSELFLKKPTDVPKHDLSLVSPFDETIGSELLNIPSTGDTMELTNINKENFNPIINDMSLLAHIDKGPKINIGRVVVGNTEKILKNRAFGEQTIIGQSNMELTKPILVMDIKENVLERTLADINSKNKTVYFADEEMELTKRLIKKSETIYFDGPESDLSITNLKCDPASALDFTCTPPISENPGVSNVNKYNKVNTRLDISPTLPNLKKNRKSIYMDQWNSDMELTSTVQCSHDIPKSINTNTPKVENACKNETVFGGSMDYTVQIGALNENCNIREDTDTSNDKSKRRTIYFDEYNADVDLTMLSNEGDIKECKGDMKILPVERSRNIYPTFLEPNFTVQSQESEKLGENFGQSEVSMDITKSECVDLEKIQSIKINQELSCTSNVSEIEHNNSGTVCNKNTPMLTTNREGFYPERNMNVSTKESTKKIHHEKEHCQGNDIDNEMPPVNNSINITGIKKLDSEHNERENISNIGEKLRSHVPSPVDADANKDQKINLQTSTLSNSNILYSEPMKIKLKAHNITPIPDLCENLNLQSLDGSLNFKLRPTSTPATSFHMTLPDMSPCIEDTQQLIHATFSKPELLSSKLPLNKETYCNQNTDIIGRPENYDIFEVDDRTRICKTPMKSSVGEKENVKPDTELGEVNDIFKTNTACNSLIVKENKTERSLYIEDESQVDLNEFNDLSSGNSSKPLENIILIPEADTISESSSETSNPNNYTARSHLVLSNIKDYLVPYKIIEDDDDTKLISLERQFKNNIAIIKDLINTILTTRNRIIDLEAKDQQEEEENASNVSEAASNSEDDKGVPSTAGLMAPKSLHERICEAAERCKDHWRFVKVENDEYCFFTLHGSLPFKVLVHPDLGIVYSVKTSTKLKDDSRPICWYILKLFRHKLEHENLLAVLGTKFDILTLLDYVNMTMEEVTNFHLEYIALVKKYGVSHHFRMNRDLSITFEVINIEIIVHWIITINMSPTTLTSIENVKCISGVGPTANEEEIKKIAANTSKGVRFLSNFIENFIEYMKRMEKKFRFRRHK